MAEDNSTFNKDTLIPKTPKKNPILLRMMVIVFATVCGIYIFSICLQQINTNNTKSLKFEAIDTPCSNYSINKSQIPYLHYPKPTTFNRAECACNPVRLFVVLSMQRSGSGWFETLLNSHINISSNGEIFGNKLRRSNITSIVTTLDRVYNLDFFTSAAKNECTAAVGFKWMLNQGLLGNYKGVVEYFNNNGVSAIFLFRRNLLRRMVSMRANSYDAQAKLVNGTHKSHTHSHAEAKMLSLYKPTINLTTLVTDLKRMELTTKKALVYLNSTRHIILYYEDIVTNRTKLKDIQEFLDLPYMELTSRQVKIHKGKLEDHVENWNDVKKTLKGTDYERFLSADDLR